jgi:hypothetical protein
MKQDRNITSFLKGIGDVEKVSFLDPLPPRGGYKNL